MTAVSTFACCHRLHIPCPANRSPRFRNSIGTSASFLFVDSTPCQTCLTSGSVSSRHVRSHPGCDSKKARDRMRFAPHRLALFLFSLFTSLGATSATADRQPILDALRSVREPLAVSVEYNYIMTARVRLLFFWAGKDDVGNGYIRRGSSSADSREEFFQVLFGSDPEKAPRAIKSLGSGHRNRLAPRPAGRSPSRGRRHRQRFFRLHEVFSGKVRRGNRKRAKK